MCVCGPSFSTNPTHTHTLRRISIFFLLLHLHSFISFTRRFSSSVFSFFSVKIPAEEEELENLFPFIKKDGLLVLRERERERVRIDDYIYDQGVCVYIGVSRVNNCTAFLIC